MKGIVKSSTRKGDTNGQKRDIHFENGEETIFCKRPRAIDAGSNLKMQSVRSSKNPFIVGAKRKLVEKEEKVAIDLTKLGPESIPPRRRLFDFILHDANGNPQPFEMSEFEDIFITAFIMPENDIFEEDLKGVNCKSFGRIESWSISGYDDGIPVIWVSTEIADYECVKPKGNYKTIYDSFYEKAHVCVEVYRKLDGGNPNLSLEELLNALTICRDAVISLGDFIYNQLIGLDESSEDGNVSLATLPALVALRDECYNKRQEKNLEARYYPVTSDKNIYIKISESEIANDYPLPAYYEPDIQEIDEHLFSEGETEICYTELPKRVLHNWAIYDADSRLVSLEILPMKPCAQLDVTVFGSGNVTEDDIGEVLWTTTDSMGIEGVPIYLSAIKEWSIDFSSSMTLISIRTDVAWYRLGKPKTQYMPWYEPVLRTAKISVNIITFLKEVRDVSRLSFADVVKRIPEFNKDLPAQFSSDFLLLERYMAVHGNIILQQFAACQDETIRNCAFVTGLSEKMEDKNHVNLVIKKEVIVQKTANLNPTVAVLHKQKLMRATMTNLIYRIWSNYYLHHVPANSNYKKLDKEKELEQKTFDPCSTRRVIKPKRDNKEIEWNGEPIGKMNSGESLYRLATIHDELIGVCGAVTVNFDDSKEPTIFFVEFMYEKFNRLKMLHGRMLLRGSQTVLGDTANERELFLTNDCMDLELGDVKECVDIDIRLLAWGHECRKAYANIGKRGKAEPKNMKRKAKSMKYYCKSLYCPERGAFFALPYEYLGLGTGICYSCKQKEIEKEDFKICSETSLIYKKNEYSINDFLYVRPQFFGQVMGLKAYAVCQLLEIEVSLSCKQPTLGSTKVKVRRFYRPEDISAAKSYTSDIRQVYYSEDIHIVPVEMVEGKCEVRRKRDLLKLQYPVIVDHIFFCEYSYDSVHGDIRKLPATVELSCPSQMPSNNFSRRTKDMAESNHLATLDFFSGCGGLSEGLQQSGVPFTKWAIEHELPAGEAFRQNHPDALVYTDDCNVILRAIMSKCGDANDCISTTKAAKLAEELDKEKLDKLPTPGEVDFITGTSPCQGEAILAFLSFADYFRPKFFLLENARNFMSFGKEETLRLTLASLLEMGYQVRFGILDAGAYGVSQTRKWFSIWGASPDEMLPEWPEPMHVCSSPELNIPMHGYMQCNAVRSSAPRASLRSITVRDVIGDLPPVKNGASKYSIDYQSDPVSWFQKQIRGGMLILHDHISKEIGESNLLHCQGMSKRNKHDIPDEKVNGSKGQIVDSIPRVGPNTDDKGRNHSKGLSRRLNWEDNFATSTTNPQPMRLHPEQDRMLTIRECARFQGFQDSYLFSGTIHDKHRQIAHAVPPPLAYALGRKLKEALDAKHS